MDKYYKQTTTPSTMGIPINEKPQNKSNTYLNGTINKKEIKWARKNSEKSQLKTNQIIDIKTKIASLLNFILVLDKEVQQKTSKTDMQFLSKEKSLVSHLNPFPCLVLNNTIYMDPNLTTNQDFLKSMIKISLKSINRKTITFINIQDILNNRMTEYQTGDPKDGPTGQNVVGQYDHRLPLMAYQNTLFIYILNIKRFHNIVFIRRKSYIYWSQRTESSDSTLYIYILKIHQSRLDYFSVQNIYLRKQIYTEKQSNLLISSFEETQCQIFNTKQLQMRIFYMPEWLYQYSFVNQVVTD
ncbi:hypothetical protein ABPG72_020059 [Tetrahymena utriculariae]